MMVYIALLVTKIYKYSTIKTTFYEKLYRKGLLISGVLRESIDTNIGHNLEGPQKVFSSSVSFRWSL